MSKKFKFGQIVGIFIGVSLGAIAASYITNLLFGKSEDQVYQNQYAQQYQYPIQNQQPQSQVGVFEQALSAPSNPNQSRIY